MKLIFLVLTGLLILLGGYLLFFAPTGVKTEFADIPAYESARAGGNLPDGAPLLPLCAQDISLAIYDGYLESVSFVCPDTDLDDAYITELEAQFIWNIELFENDRVVLSRVNGE